MSSAPAAPAAAFTEPRDQATSDSNALPLLAAIALGLVLVYAGGRLLLRRRAQRRQLEVSSGREADWEAVLRQIKLTRAPGTPNPGGEQLRQIEVDPDPAPLKMQTGGMAGPDQATGNPAEAR